MLIEPMTPAWLFRIDRMVIILPNEIGYPPTNSFDACTMIGVRIYKVESCQLLREFGYTFVTIIPPASYSNEVSIVTVSDSNEDNLFVCP